MSVVRTQHLTRTVAALPAGLTTVDILRPVSTSLPPYTENSDWVINPRADIGSEGGKVFIDLPAAFELVTVFLRSIEVWDSGKSPQSGLSGPLYPSGAATATNPVRVETIWSSTTDTLACNDVTVGAMLGTPVAGTLATAQIQPGITVGADQFVRLVFNNTAGGIGASAILAKYDMGLNQANLPSM